MDTGQIVEILNRELRPNIPTIKYASVHFYGAGCTPEKSPVVGDALNKLLEMCIRDRHGAGWGHGVGLCQIGAAVMGEKGYSYREILSHYYPGTDVTKLYQHDEH